MVVIRSSKIAVQNIMAYITIHFGCLCNFIFATKLNVFMLAYLAKRARFLQLTLLYCIATVLLLTYLIVCPASATVHLLLLALPAAWLGPRRPGGRRKRCPLCRRRSLTSRRMRRRLGGRQALSVSLVFSSPAIASYSPTRRGLPGARGGT